VSEAAHLGGDDGEAAAVLNSAPAAGAAVSGSATMRLPDAS